MEWECEVCEAINSSEDALCMVCTSRKPPPVARGGSVSLSGTATRDGGSTEAASSTDKWTCAACTFENDTITRFCHMCGGGRGIDGSPSPPAHGLAREASSSSNSTQRAPSPPVSRVRRRISASSGGGSTTSSLGGASLLSHDEHLRAVEMVACPICGKRVQLAASFDHVNACSADAEDSPSTPVVVAADAAARAASASSAASHLPGSLAEAIAGELRGRRAPISVRDRSRSHGEQASAGGSRVAVAPRTRYRGDVGAERVEGPGTAGDDGGHGGSLYDGHRRDVPGAGVSLGRRASEATSSSGGSGVGGDFELANCPRCGAILTFEEVASHVEECTAAVTTSPGQEPLRADCPHCHRGVLQSALPIHMQVCSRRREGGEVVGGGPVAPQNSSRSDAAHADRAGAAAIPPPAPPSAPAPPVARMASDSSLASSLASSTSSSAMWVCGSCAASNVVADLRCYACGTPAQAHAEKYRPIKALLKSISDMEASRAWRALPSELTKLASMARDLGDRELEGNTVGQLGLAFLRLGMFEKAEETLRQQLALGTTHELPRVAMCANGNLAVVMQQTNRHADALSLLHRSLEIATEQLHDSQAEAQALTNIGVSQDALGNFEAAVVSHERRLQIAQELDDLEGIAIACGNLGCALQGLGEYDKAFANHQRQLSYASTHDRPDLAAKAFGNMGTVLECQGKLRGAADCYEKQLTAAESSSDMQSVLAANKSMGLVYAELDDFDRARKAFAAAIEAAAELRLHPIEAELRGQLGRLLLSAGELEEGGDQLERQMRLASASDDDYALAVALTQRATRHVEEGSPGEAIPLLRRALVAAGNVRIERGQSSSRQLPLAAAGAVAVQVAAYSQLVRAHTQEGRRADVARDVDMQQLHFGEALASADAASTQEALDDIGLHTQRLPTPSWSVLLEDLTLQRRVRDEFRSVVFVVYGPGETAESPCSAFVLPVSTLLVDHLTVNDEVDAAADAVAPAEPLGVRGRFDSIGDDGPPSHPPLVASTSFDSIGGRDGGIDEVDAPSRLSAAASERRGSFGRSIPGPRTSSLRDLHLRRPAKRVSTANPALLFRDLCGRGQLPSGFVVRHLYDQWLGAAVGEHLRAAADALPREQGLDIVIVPNKWQFAMPWTAMLAEDEVLFPRVNSVRVSVSVGSFTEIAAREASLRRSATILAGPVPVMGDGIADESRAVEAATRASGLDVVTKIGNQVTPEAMCAAITSFSTVHVAAAPVEGDCSSLQLCGAEGESELGDSIDGGALLSVLLPPEGEADGGAGGVSSETRPAATPPEVVVLSTRWSFDTPPDDLQGLLAVGRSLRLAGVPSVVQTLWTASSSATVFLMIRLHMELDAAKRVLPAVALLNAQRWLRTVTLSELFALLDHLGRHGDGDFAHLRSRLQQTKENSGIADDDCPFHSARHWACAVALGL